MSNNNEDELSEHNSNINVVNNLHHLNIMSGYCDSVLLAGGDNKVTQAMIV